MGSVINEPAIKYFHQLNNLMYFLFTIISKRIFDLRIITIHFFI